MRKQTLRNELREMKPNSKLNPPLTYKIVKKIASFMLNNS